MPKETIATTDVYDSGVPHTNILKVAWGAKGSHPEAPEGWVNAGYAHLYIGTKDEPFLGSVELGEDEIDHLIRVLKRVRRQAFRAWTQEERLLAVAVDAARHKPLRVKRTPKVARGGL